MSFSSFDENRFYESIENRDFLALKINVMSAMRNDPTFARGEVDRVIKILEEKVPEIFEKEEHFDFEERLPREKWDKRYFTALTYYFLENFAKSRISYIREVGKVVHKDTEKRYNASLERYNASLKHNLVGSLPLKEYLSNISELLKVGYEKIKEIDRETSKSIDSGDIDSQNKLEEKRKEVSSIMRKCNQYVSIIAKEVKKSNKKAIESASTFDSDSQLECSMCALEATGICGEVAMEDAKSSLGQKLKTMWKKFITNVINFFKRMSMVIKNKISNMTINSTSKKITGNTSINLSKEDKEYLDKLPDEIKKIKEM